LLLQRVYERVLNAPLEINPGSACRDGRLKHRFRSDLWKTPDRHFLSSIVKTS
jgi:hypothetical protein